MATAHRPVAELVAAGLLSRRLDSRYQVGARMWRPGLLAPPTVLREVALPFLQDLVIATGRTVHLAVLDGDRAMVVDRLVATRAEGIARSAQEHRIGVSSLAMPVFGASGVVAAAAVLAPLTRPRLSVALTPMAAAVAAIGAAVRTAEVDVVADGDPENSSVVP